MHFSRNSIYRGFRLTKFLESPRVFKMYIGMYLSYLQAFGLITVSNSYFFFFTLNNLEFEGAF